MKGMTLAQYWALIVKRYRLVVSCFLLVGLGALVVSRLMTPLYQSTALVQIMVPAGNSQLAYNSLLASDQLVQTEAILATSEPVLHQVASHYPDLSVDQLGKEVTVTPKLNTQLFEIDVLDASPTRAAGLANDIATTLIQQQTQLMQQQTAQTSDFLLLAQPAQPSLKPVRPNIPLNTGAGLLVGLLLGILLAVLLEQLDTHARTPEAVTQLSGYPILATIWKADPNTEVINPKRSDANVESYRILRTSIGFSTIDKSLRSLVITSCSPKDGKSTVAANLAIFMAKAGKKTLLVDADLRRPSLHEIFDLSASSMGLSNAILAFSMLSNGSGAATGTVIRSTEPHAYRQQSSTDRSTGASDPSAATIRNGYHRRSRRWTHGFFNTSVQLSNESKATKPSLDAFVHTVGIPNLLVMPSGPLPPNPSELLDSQAMLHCFAALTSYDGIEMVIFDSPPLIGLADSSILASKADGTLVVIDITRAKKKDIKELSSLLAQAGAHVLGCVLNKQSRSRNDTIYSYYSIDEQDSANHNKMKQEVFAPLPNTPSDSLTQQEAQLH
jgi:Mrp family chromosome partitioning ATPase